MGIFVRTVESKDAGETITIKAPAGKGSINKIYITSTNLAYASVKTEEGVNSVIKSANTNYQEGYYPLQQRADEIDVTVFGMGSAEAVTVETEWV